MEGVLRKGQGGGIVIGGKKIWSLSFADDITLMAESAVGLKEVMERFGRYVSGKQLEISKEKSKVVVFSRGGRKGKERWTLEEEEIEEVKEYKYLGMVFSNTGGYKKHIEDRVKKQIKQ